LNNRNQSMRSSLQARVREGIRLLESCYGQSTGERIVGLGKFSSGISDLGSNQGHLKGFGR